MSNEVKLTPSLQLLLAACASGKEPEDYLFTRVPKKQRHRPQEEQGQRRITDFRNAWRRVTKAAGCTALLFHDLCRYAARTLDSAGVSQTVGMAVMGRKTDSIYKRYRIVDRRDIDRAVDQVVMHGAHKSQRKRANTQQKTANTQFNRRSGTIAS